MAKLAPADSSNMGLSIVPVHVANLEGRTFAEVEAMVDFGAVTTLVPRTVLESVGIVSESRETLTIAARSCVSMSMVQARVHVDGCETITWVIFGDDRQPLARRAHPRRLFLVVDPYNRRLVPLERLPLQLLPLVKLPNLSHYRFERLP